MNEPDDDLDLEDDLDFEPENGDDLDFEPEPPPPPPDILPPEHGVTCVKVPHDQDQTGYLHGEADDHPYEVDGVVYCGRCHVFLGAKAVKAPPLDSRALGDEDIKRDRAQFFGEKHGTVKMTQAEALADQTRARPQWDAEKRDPQPRQATSINAATKPGEQALARQSTDLVTQARALKVNTPDTFQHAGQIITVLTAKVREIEAFFEDDVERAHATWKGLTTKRASYVTPLKEAIATLSYQYSEFSRESKRKAEQVKREREEAERKKEQDRINAEAQAAADRAAALAAQAVAATSRDEAAVLEAEADDLVREAEDLKVAAAEVQAPVIHVASEAVVEKGAPGVKGNWTWEFKPNGFDALILAVAEAIKGARADVTSEALQPNTPYINRRVKADKDKTRLPGIRAYDKGTVNVPRPK